MRIFLSVCLVAPLLTQVATDRLPPPRPPPTHPSPTSTSRTTPTTAAPMRSRPTQQPRPGSSHPSSDRPSATTSPAWPSTENILFASTRSGIYIAQFLIQSDGALHWNQINRTSSNSIRATAEPLAHSSWITLVPLSMIWSSTAIARTIPISHLPLTNPAAA